MDGITFMGIVAGMLTSAGFVPQLFKAWKTKSTGDVSLWMYLITSTGILLWLIYGLIINSLPLILANAFTLVIAVSILALKIRYR
jgi:MtN3 and saliva related transmembrane protein